MVRIALPKPDPATKVPELTSVIQVELPSGNEISVVRRRFFGQPDSGPRVAIVAGLRGDAPEGIRVAYRVAEFLVSVEDKLCGTVDVYPCVNPLAAHQGTRLWPFFDVDLNRLFPGRSNGHPPDRVARAVYDDVVEADQVIELRGARPAFSEATQAHVRRRDTDAAELASHANVAVVWRRQPGPAAPGTFAHQFPGTIVLEGGSGNRLIPSVGKDLFDGVLNLLATIKVLPDEHLPFHWAGLQRPIQVTDDEVIRVRTARGGLFLPAGEIWAEVSTGTRLGEVIDPITGERLEEVLSPGDGRILAVRERPVVFPGTMVARVVKV